MKLIHSLIQKSRHFARDTSGNVLVIFAFCLIPLILVIGTGADFGLAMNYKHKLQSAVDSAALAGASAYTSTSGTAVPISVAKNYMAKYISTLPASLHPTYKTSAATVVKSGNTAGYTVTVTASLVSANAFMSIGSAKSTNVSVSATAENPVLTATFNTGGFASKGADNNQIYWFIVPKNGGVPSSSSMNLLWDNSNPNPPSIVSFNLMGGDKIGFALENTTGGNQSYGNNMYGSQPGDTQWFYSSLQPPSASYDIAPGGNGTGTHGTYPTTQDCSLVVENGTTSGGVTTFPAAPQGTCFTGSGSGANTNINDDPTDLTGFCYGCGNVPPMAQELGNAAPSCAQLNGNTLQYDWNDMGWMIDSLNYGNDMQYSFSCSGTSGGTSSGVYLVQ